MDSPLQLAFKPGYGFPRRRGVNSAYFMSKTLQCAHAHKRRLPSAYFAKEQNLHVNLVQLISAPYALVSAFYTRMLFSNFPGELSPMHVCA